MTISTCAPCCASSSGGAPLYPPCCTGAGTAIGGVPNGGVPPGPFPVLGTTIYLSLYVPTGNPAPDSNWNLGNFNVCNIQGEVFIGDPCYGLIIPLNYTTTPPLTPDDPGVNAEISCGVGGWYGTLTLNGGETQFWFGYTGRSNAFDCTLPVIACQIAIYESVNGTNVFDFDASDCSWCVPWVMQDGIGGDYISSGLGTTYGSFVPIYGVLLP